MCGGMLRKRGKRGSEACFLWLCLYIYNNVDVGLNGCSSRYSGMGYTSIFLSENEVRVTVSVTFRVTLLGFAKTKCVD